MYVMSETAETRSARFAMMYDKDALYLSGVVRDPIPMMNRHDPKVDAGNSWNGCSWQLRLSVDPAKGYPVTDNTGCGSDNPKLLLMTFWYYTDRQERLHADVVRHELQAAASRMGPYGAVPRTCSRANTSRRRTGSATPSSIAFPGPRSTRTRP